MALRAFFEALPPDTGMSFVVIMHLDPEHESDLPGLLQSRTDMTVVQVNQTVQIEPNHIYVIPPSKRLEATDHSLSAHDFDEPRGQRAPIDLFFRSLARAHGDGAAIVLSGGGTDGSVGIKAIKEAGGLVLVQDPEEAEYDSMPRSAIATGVVDVVLPASELARRLAELVTQEVRLPESPEALSEAQASTLRSILVQLRARTGHDFSRYKGSTVMRRLQRRMQISGREQFVDYLACLRDDPEEAQTLFRELLIGVTNFFRDPECFAALNEKIVPKLFHRSEGGQNIRVWVTGCSTGEEAYSMALLLADYAAKHELHPDIQVFASDLDPGSLAVAREGVYPASIQADVPEELLRRFFVREGDHYQVIRDLREMVLFTPHSVLKDPPFSRIDLVTCRNLLIYLERDLQEQVFQIFHYALRLEGYLFLGSSETTENATDLFSVVDKKHRIYQAKKRTRHVPHLPLLTDDEAGDLPEWDMRPKRGSARERVSEGQLHRQMLEEHAPPSLLVDENYQVVHLSERTGRYLQHPGGTITKDFMQLVRPELKLELSSALFQAFQKGKTTVARPVRVRFDGETHVVYLTVRPRVRQGDSERLALVLFDEDEVTEDVRVREAGDDEKEASVLDLEEELRRTRERLRATVDEFETSREQLNAQNEELRSMNEEYRSTMEELETSKEELQSVNEELQTVNSELKASVEEISQAHSDLQNLMTATEIGILFLDRDLRIKRYTPEAERYFNVVASDRGRPISHLTHSLEYPDLEEDARRVLETLKTLEREVQDRNGTCFLVRLQPYRTVNDRIDGVVITFVDITRMKRAEEQLRAAKEYAELIVDTVHEGMLVLDADLRVQTASAAFYEQFRVTREQTEGRLIYELGEGQWDIPELRALLEDVLPAAKTLNDFEVEHEFAGLGRRVMLLNARQIDHQQLILLAIEDVTERKQAVRELQRVNETLEGRVSERTKQVRELAARLTIAEQEERRRVSMVLHDDLQQRLHGIHLKIGSIRRAATSGRNEELLEQIDEASAWTTTAIQTTRQLSVAFNPPVLKEGGLTRAIRWLQSQMQEMYGLRVEVKAEHGFRIADEDKRVLLFQVVRELLFNIVKHAETDHASVELHDSNDELIIRVLDEGCGFDVKKAAARDEHEQKFGLFSVGERLNLFGGRMEIDSAPGQGTRVTVRIPVNWGKVVSG